MDSARAVLSGKEYDGAQNAEDCDGARNETECGGAQVETAGQTAEAEVHTDVVAGLEVGSEEVEAGCYSTAAAGHVAGDVADTGPLLAASVRAHASREVVAAPQGQLVWL